MGCTSIEEYIRRLQEIASEHPNARMVAFDSSDVPDWEKMPDAYPEWSERDQVVYVNSPENPDEWIIL